MLRTHKKTLLTEISSTQKIALPLVGSGRAGLAVERLPAQLWLLQLLSHTNRASSGVLQCAHECTCCYIMAGEEEGGSGAGGEVQ